MTGLPFSITSLFRSNLEKDTLILFVTANCIIWFQVRCWEVQDNGQTVPKAQQMHTGPVLDACWSDVGFIRESNVDAVSCSRGHDVLYLSTRMGVKSSLLHVTRQQRCGILTAIKRCRLHRLDQITHSLPRSTMLLWMKWNYLKHFSFSAQHDGPIKAIHWIKAPNYNCVMTGSWDKTLKVHQLSLNTLRKSHIGFVFTKWKLKLQFWWQS